MGKNNDESQKTIKKETKTLKELIHSVGISMLVLGIVKLLIAWFCTLAKKEK